MTDEKDGKPKYPPPNVRGGAEDWSKPPDHHGWPRCVDCPQFMSLDGRVDRLEVALLDVDKRLHGLEATQKDHTGKLERLEISIGRVLRWLDGDNSRQSGFRVEWALMSAKIQRGITIRERVAWATGGLLGAGMLGLVGKVLLDAIQRGITP